MFVCPISEVQRWFRVRLYPITITITIITILTIIKRDPSQCPNDQYRRLRSSSMLRRRKKTPPTTPVSTRHRFEQLLKDQPPTLWNKAAQSHHRIPKKAQTKENLDDHRSQTQRSPPRIGIGKPPSEGRPARREPPQTQNGLDRQGELHQDHLGLRRRPSGLASPVLSDEGPVSSNEVYTSRCIPATIKLEDDPGTVGFSSIMHDRYSSRRQMATQAHTDLLQRETFPEPTHVYRMTPLTWTMDADQDAHSSRHYADLKARLRRGQYRSFDNHTEVNQVSQPRQELRSAQPPPKNPPSRRQTRQSRLPKVFYALDYYGKLREVS